MRFNALCVAALGGLATLVVPLAADAGNVGYYRLSDCGSAVGDPISEITAAGHTPVALATLDNASLAPLGGLVLQVCDSAYPGSAAVNAAVGNGLRLMVDTNKVLAANDLPGSPALSLFPDYLSNLSIANNAPNISGPGGTLTNDSLDTGAPGGGNGTTSTIGSVRISTLPAGGQPLMLSAAYPSNAPAFYYPVGAGLVVVSMSQWSWVLPSGGYPTDYLSPGARTYFINTIAWMMAAVVEPVATCASEGYKGTQLTWCKNICESGLTGKALDTWIQRWISKYRELPYCAVD